MAKWIKKIVSKIEGIEEWQAMQCSACGKWHTIPYLYYIYEHEYCPNCGARMDGKDDGKN